MEKQVKSDSFAAALPRLTTTLLLVLPVAGNKSVIARQRNMTLTFARSR